MKDKPVSKRAELYLRLEQQIQCEGWLPVDTIPIRGEVIEVLTVTGIQTLAKVNKYTRYIRRPGHGIPFRRVNCYRVDPEGKRTTGDILAIAWKPRKVIIGGVAA